MPQDWLSALFTAIDAMDTPRFLEFLTDDATFRFGNLPPCYGKLAIGTAVGAFFASIKASRHEVLGSWTHPDSIICYGRVHYTRHDGTRVTVPFANVLMRQGELVRDYLIFADLTPLYAVPDSRENEAGDGDGKTKEV